MAAKPRFEKLAAEAKSRIQEASATEAHQRQARGAVLVDVREAEEFSKEHAHGALHLSKGVLELKIEEAVTDASTPIVLYCGGGSRSALAAESLLRMGYENVWSLAGGFKAWKQAGLPTT